MLSHTLCLLGLTLCGLQDPTPAPKPAEAPPKTARQLAQDLSKAERKAGRARLAQRLSVLKSEDEIARAELTHSDKQRARDQVKRELDLFKRFDGPAAVAAAELALDRSGSRLLAEQQDLEGILQIYAEEQEARSKDEIIRRHRISVTFAERAVTAAELQLEKAKASVELEQDEKAWALTKAEREVELAGRAVARAQLAAQLEAAKAEDEILTAEAALETATRKVQVRGQASKSSGEAE